MYATLRMEKSLIRTLSACTVTNRTAAESWKKLTSGNVVQLREAIQTSAFNDNCTLSRLSKTNRFMIVAVIFVSEYYPDAATLKQRFFGRSGEVDNTC